MQWEVKGTVIGLIFVVKYLTQKICHMKRVILFFILSFFLMTILFSCKVNWDPFEKPVIPEDKEYDLNNDNIIDFKIVHQAWTWDGLNSSGDLYSCELVPTNSTQVLVHSESGLLARRLSDTLFHQVNTPLSWKSSHHDIPFLLSIKSTSNIGWEREWHTMNNIKDDFYYISLIIPAAGNESLGWIKLEINNLTGAIGIKDQEFVNREYLIIEK